jgi:hypothetical protein
MFVTLRLFAPARPCFRMQRMTPPALRWVLLAAVAFFGACDQPPPATSKSAGEAALPPAKGPTVDLLFTYGSEKEEWIKAVTAEFHRTTPKLASGKAIRVLAVPKGSGESIDEIIAGTAKPHLTALLQRLSSSSATRNGARRPARI